MNDVAPVFGAVDFATVVVEDVVAVETDAVAAVDVIFAAEDVVDLIVAGEDVVDLIVAREDVVDLIVAGEDVVDLIFAGEAVVDLIFAEEEPAACAVVLPVSLVTAFVATDVAAA